MAMCLATTLRLITSLPLSSLSHMYLLLLCRKSVPPISTSGKGLSRGLSTNNSSQINYNSYRNRMNIFYLLNNKHMNCVH